MLQFPDPKNPRPQPMLCISLLIPIIPLLQRRTRRAPHIGAIARLRDGVAAAGW